MDIKNPRRILALGAPESGVLKLLQGKQLSINAPFEILTLSRAYRFRTYTHLRIDRWPLARMASRNQILHCHSPNMG